MTDTRLRELAAAATSFFRGLMTGGPEPAPLPYDMPFSVPVREYQRIDRDALAAKPAEPLDAAFAPLFAEARAFEEWYLPTRMGVNAWVGVDTVSGLYGGWSIEGDPLYDDWDESIMTTAEGETVEAVIADLIRIARDYRQRRDEENAALRADAAEYAALRSESPDSEPPRSDPEFLERPCPACGAALAPADTHFDLMAGPAGEYVCPSPDSEPEAGT